MPAPRGHGRWANSSDWEQCVRSGATCSIDLIDLIDLIVKLCSSMLFAFMICARAVCRGVVNWVEVSEPKESRRPQGNFCVFSSIGIFGEANKQWFNQSINPILSYPIPSDPILSYSILFYYQSLFTCTLLVQVMATENLPNWPLRGSRSTKGVVPKSAKCQLEIKGYWTTLEMFVRTSISGRAHLSPAVPQTVDVDGLDIASPETRPSKFLHFPWQNHRNDRFLWPQWK